MISERAGVLDEDVDALGPTHVAQSLDPAEEYQSADFGLDGELSVAAPVPTPDFEDAVARLEARGGIEAHVNRYGSDPTKCPFFRQMGAAGLKLAGEIETSAKNPNRGKTIAELLAEKRRQQDKVHPLGSQAKTPAPRSTSNYSPKKSDKFAAEKVVLKAHGRVTEAEPRPKATLARSDDRLLIDEQLQRVNVQTPRANPSKQPRKDLSRSRHRKSHRSNHELSPVVAEAYSENGQQPFDLTPYIAVRVVAPERRTTPDKTPRTSYEDEGCATGLHTAAAAQSEVFTPTESKGDYAKAEAATDVAIPAAVLAGPSAENLSGGAYGLSAVITGPGEQGQHALAFPEPNSYLASLETVLGEWLAKDEQRQDPSELVAFTPSMQADELRVDPVTAIEGSATEEEPRDAIIETLATAPSQRAEVFSALTEIAGVLDQLKVKAEGPEDIDTLTQRLEILCSRLFETVGFTLSEAATQTIVRDLAGLSRTVLPLSAEQLPTVGTHEYKRLVATVVWDYFAQAVHQRLELLRQLGRYILDRANKLLIDAPKLLESTKRASALVAPMRPLPFP